MKKPIKPGELKSFLDEFIVIPITEYDRLVEIVELQEYEKREVLRPAGAIENFAYLIIDGAVGLECDGKLERIYFPKDVAFDVKSFSENTKSPFSLVVLKPTSLVSLSKANESRVLEEIPSFKDLSEKIWDMARKSDQEWVKISQMHYFQAIPILQEKLSDHFKTLNSKQLGELVGVNSRSIIRYHKKIYNQRRSLIVKAKAKELFDYPFRSIIHSDVEEIDSITTCWASELKLLPNSPSIIKYQKMKMTWLSARLYPESKFEKAIWLAKLYALLFILDDYTDKIKSGEKHDFWENLKVGFNTIFETGTIPKEKGMLRNFLVAFADLWQDLQTITTQPYISNFTDLMMSYIDENIWESLNLDLGNLPTIDTYLSKRPVFSGGFLALNLIPFTMEEDYKDINEVWKSLSKYIDLASKLIYISNDLLSFDKENKLKDPHNWVYLLIHLENQEKDKAIEIALDHHNKVLKEFIQLDRAFQENYSPADRTLLSAIKNIKYQVSGAVAWSVNDTTRYIDF